MPKILLRTLMLVGMPILMFFSVNTAEAATYTVTSTSNSGAGTLRQAIIDANANSGSDSIVCGGALSGSITVATALPTLTEAVSIDCSGSASQVTLTTSDGSLTGLTVDGTGSYSIKGFTVDGFTNGIYVVNASATVMIGGTNAEEDMVVQNNVSGLVLDGSTAVTVVNTQVTGGTTGITIGGTASGVTIGGLLTAERNVVTGNVIGIKIGGSSDNTQVINNYIGLQGDGTTISANTQVGIKISGSFPHAPTGVVIGGSTSAYGNVISGNGLAGAELEANGATFRNNIVGLNAAGTSAKANYDGVLVTGSSNIIQENTIAGNSNMGVLLRDDIGVVDSNQILDNTIGLDVAETAKVANLRGVVLRAVEGAGITDTLIQDNRIAGNTSHGIEIQDAITTGTQIWGNIIGSNTDLDASLGNGGSSLSIKGADTDMDASLNAAKRNIIIGNGAPLAVSTASGLILKNNYIGWDGTAAATNTGAVITLSASTSNNAIGGVGTNEGNTFCADAGTNEYVNVASDAGNGNSVRGNRIRCDIGLNGDRFIAVTATGNNSYTTAPAATTLTSTTVAGTGACASCSVDVYGYIDTPDLVYVTTLTANGSGVFSGSIDLSAYTGAFFAFTGSNGSTSTASALIPLSDSLDNFTITTTSDSGAGSLRAALINAASSPGVNTLTCDAALTGTITLLTDISPLTEGLTLDCSDTASIITVAGSNILFDINSGSGYVFKGLKTQGFSTVFDLASAVSDVTLGGTGTGENLYLYDPTQTAIISAADNLTIQNTEIELATTGISIASGSSTVALGTASATGTLSVHDNSANGITIAGASGLTVYNTTLDDNGASGIEVSSSSSGVTIGGTASNQRNVIIGSSGAGLLVTSASSLNVVNNYIGIQSDGTTANGNTTNGVNLSGTCTSCIIGGATSAEGNVIGSNGSNGLAITAAGVTAQNNKIGTNAAGTAARANGSAGISVAAASVTIEDNLVSGNTGTGISVTDSTAVTGLTIASNTVGLKADQVTALGNGDGGIVLNGSSGGGITGALVEDNIVSGNTGIGIRVTGSGAVGTQVWGNKIGTDLTGLLARGNSSAGLSLGGGGSSDLDASLDSAKRNIVAGNSGDCITIASPNNVLRNQYCGFGANGTTEITNGSSTIALDTGAVDNIIGGIESDQGNLMCASSSFNVYILLNTNAGNGNSIRGNTIGCDDFRIPLVGFGNLVAEMIARPLGGTSNNSYVAPTFSHVTPLSVSGTGACANCSVDIYGQDSARGAVYVGSGTANGSGAWAFEADVSAYDYAIATFTGTQGSTSVATAPLALEAEDDADGDGMSNITEVVVGTSDSDSTDNDTVAEQTRTLFLASDTTADGVPSAAEMRNTAATDGGATELLSNVVSLLSNQYEEGFADPTALGLPAYETPGYPTRAELQAVIDAVNGGNTPEFILTQSSGTTVLLEGGTDTFTVVLSGMTPTTDVVFDVSSADTGAATVSPSTLTFTSENWNTPQTVTVSGVADADVLDETTDITVSINAAASDDSFDALADQIVSASVTDQLGAFTVTQSGGTTALLEGGTDTFTVALASLQPSSNVVLNVTSGDTGGATVSPSTLTFTSGNWDTPQTVTVSGVSDVDTNNESVTITLAVDDASSFDSYDAVADQTVTAAVTDTTEEDTPSSGNGSGGGGGAHSSQPTPQVPTTPQEPEPIKDVLVIDTPVIKESLAQEKDPTVLGDEFTIEEGRKYGYPVGAFDPASDADMDGLPYFDEIVMLSSNEDSDTDGDGIADGLEVLTGTDPLNPNEFKVDALDITLDCPDGTSFPDTEENFARIAVCMLAHQGIIQGREVDAFVPEAEVTRAELTKMILLTAGITPKSLPAYAFNDLDFDAWYYPYVTTAHKVGLVTGYGDGTFKPNQSVTRAEAISILIRAFRGDDQSALENPYQDVLSNDWFAHNVLLGSHDGLIVGRTPGFFAPLGTLTRAEAAILIRRAQYAYAQ